MVRVVGQGGSSGGDMPPSHHLKDGKGKAVSEPMRKKKNLPRGHPHDCEGTLAAVQAQEAI